MHFIFIIIDNLTIVLTVGSVKYEVKKRPCFFFLAVCLESLLFNSTLN